MRKILTKITKEHFAIIFGIIICLFIFWNRVLRTRNPYVLQDLHYTTIGYILISITIFMLIILNVKSIITILKFNILNFKFLTSNSKIKDLLIFIKESPKELFIFIFNKVSFNFLETPMSYVVVYFYNTTGILFITLLMLLPTLIMSIIFFTEVIFYNSVFIFIKTLPLLIIPLLLRFVIHASNIQANAMLDYVRIYLEFFKYENQDQVYVRIKDEFKDVTPEISLKTCIDLHTIYSNMKNFTDSIEEKKAELTSYFTFLYSMLYLISWLYILYYSFYH
jgi:hypothetical protein